MPNFLNFAGHDGTAENCSLKHRPGTQQGWADPWGLGDMGDSWTGRAGALPGTGRSKAKPGSLVCGRVYIREIHGLAQSDIAWVKNRGEGLSLNAGLK